MKIGSLALAIATSTAFGFGCDAHCPDYGTPVVAGVVAQSDVTEASGVAGGRLDPSVLWIHNDSGDAARVFAIDTAGAWRGTFLFDGATATDWEDIAVGPGPEAGVPYLYVGDIGDNGESRASVSVYRAPEPVVGEVPGTVSLAGVERIRLAYPDRPHNAETLLVDPANGDLYIVTKPAAAGLASQVFQAAAPLDTVATTTLTEVASLVFGADPLPGGAQPTGGDIDGLRQFIAIRTYTSAFAWCFEPGATVADTLAGPPCSLWLAGEGQGEALGFAADGSAYFTLSEGAHPSLHRYDRIPTP